MNGSFFAASSLRSIAIGFISVYLAFDLINRHFTAAETGIVVTAGLMGNTLAAMLVGYAVPRWGRRILLIGFTFLMVLFGLAMAFTDSIVALILFSFLGMLNGMGKDRSGLRSIDQTLVPEFRGESGRTSGFALYNFLMDAGCAIGGLLSALPLHLGAAQHLAAYGGYALFLATSGILYSAIPLYYDVSATTPRMQEKFSMTETYRACEGSRSPDCKGGDERASSTAPKALYKDNSAQAATRSVSPESRKKILELSLLFSLDSLGGGFLSTTLIAYWFFQRFHPAAHLLAAIIFFGRALNGISNFGASWLARRIGLVNTMVFTHLPSSLFLIAATFSPSFTIASVFFLLRESLVQMDVPARDSYTMGIVKPEERPFAASATTTVRNLGWAVSPVLGGEGMSALFPGFSLISGAALKIAYDILLYVRFRLDRPPEER